jgi:hypothetical protein
VAGRVPIARAPIPAAHDPRATVLAVADPALTVRARILVAQGHLPKIKRATRVLTRRSSMQYSLTRTRASPRLVGPIKRRVVAVRPSFGMTPICVTSLIVTKDLIFTVSPMLRVGPILTVRRTNTATPIFTKGLIFTMDPMLTKRPIFRKSPLFRMSPTPTVSLISRATARTLLLQGQLRAVKHRSLTTLDPAHVDQHPLAVMGLAFEAPSPKANACRKCYRAPASRHAARRKTGFAPAASPSTALRPCLVRVCCRPISFASIVASFANARRAGELRLSSFTVRRVKV